MHYLITYWRYGLGSLQVERIGDAGILEARIAALQADCSVSDLEIWETARRLQPIEDVRDGRG